MKSYFYNVFSSYRTSLVLLIIYAAVLALATVIEKFYGPVAARKLVYNAPIFFLLNIALIINFIISSYQRKYIKNKRWSVLITHFSLIIILIGASITFLFSYEGILHLREGETSNRLVIQKGNGGAEIKQLPFSVELQNFKIGRYPGSNSPSFYESHVIIHSENGSKQAHIYMNNVLNIDSYRLYQASYDEDEKGTVLLVNQDKCGRTVTYTGYLFLLLGLILTVFGSKSRLARLNSNLKVLTVFTLTIITGPLSGKSLETSQFPPAINQEHAARFGKMYMLSDHGRIIPINTFSSEILRKLHKANSIGGMNSDQFLLSLLSVPEQWISIPFIANSNDQIADLYGLNKGHCAFSEIFDQNGNYKLSDTIEKIYKKLPSSRNRFDKDIMKLDEKMNIFNQIINAERLHIFPCEHDANGRWYAPGDDLSVFTDKDSLFVSHIFMWYLDEVNRSASSGDWTAPDRIIGMIGTFQNAKAKGVGLSENKMKAEYLYNRSNIFRYCRIGYLISGTILLILSFIMISGSHRYLKKIYDILYTIVIIFFLLHTLGIAARWYIGGYAPWSNSYETMIYVAWITVLAGMLFSVRSHIVFSLATTLGGITLFVSGLNWMDPQINPLVPVLKSPWLMFHVAVIVASYGFLGISAIIGMTDLFILCIRTKSYANKLKELTIINEMSMWLGLCLLITGTFLGAIWANESWGRYWGWDPKETWALITILVYVMVTHIHLIKGKYTLWLFNFLSIAAFLSVLMTFFGVNYFLSGMHSYGGKNNFEGVSMYFVIISVILLVLLSIQSFYNYKMEYGKSNSSEI